MSTPVGFKCSVCGLEKMFNHHSWRSRRGAETFCTDCRKVTSFRNPLYDGPHDGRDTSVTPAGSGPPGSAATPGTGSAATPSAGAGTAGGARTTLPSNVPPISDPVELWADLCVRLASKGTRAEDLAGADPETLRQAFTSLGYDPLTAAKLQSELQERYVNPKAEAAAAIAAVEATKPPPPEPPPAKADFGTSPARAVERQQVEAGMTTPAMDPEYADGTTSVDSAIVEDETTRRTARLMEEELKKMDQELKDTRAKLAQAEAERAAREAATSPPLEERISPLPEVPEPVIPYPELNASKAPTRLWPVLVERLSACGATEDDITSCSPAAFDEVLRQLAFTPIERARLQQEYQEKHGVGAKDAAPAPAAPDPPVPGNPPVGLRDPSDDVGFNATPLNFTGAPTGANIGAAGGSAPEVGTNLKGEPMMLDPAALHRWPHWQGPGYPSVASANAASDDGGGEWAALPRCPVFPDKEVEFWDPITETLVSAHAHLNGLHKDHPFVPMVDAARKELPGLADWQTRAAGLNAKLMDHRGALDEVHETIDSIHQQQIENVVLTVDQLKKQLDDHRDQLVKRIRGHAAAQHELFRPTTERLRNIRASLDNQLGVLDTHLGAKTELMADEDLKRWAVGIMGVREQLGSTFAADSLQPLTVSNWTQLRFNVDVGEEIMSRLYLTKAPATVPLPSLIDLREISHPLYTNRDRINFKFVEPEPPTDGTARRSPIELRHDNLTAGYTGGGSGHILVKTSATFEAGRHYWEVRIDSAHNDNRLGTHIIMGLVAEGTNSMGATTGLAWRVDTVSGMVPMAVDSPPWTPGTLLGIFLDLEMDRVGLYHNKQCVAHLAIPHGRYTPAVSIQCAEDQVTLVPLSDIPHGVTLTSGLSLHKDAYGRSVRREGQSLAILNREVPPTAEDVANQQHIEQLQSECVRLQTQIKDTKRELSEQTRLQGQQKFQNQQIADLKRRIDETAQIMAKQQIEFESSSSEDLRKLQETKHKQLEDEMKRTWQLQAETAQRTRDARGVAQRQQEQQGQFDRFLREQQVLITEQLLDRQRKAADNYPPGPLVPPGVSVAGSPLTRYPPGLPGAPTGALPPPPYRGEISPGRARPPHVVSPAPYPVPTAWDAGSAARARDLTSAERAYAPSGYTR
eukprot:Hpha_TRINITY_DN10012_c0_g1::TRINITY_DN10012_c0_g1_i2::g.84100::m.84100